LAGACAVLRAAGEDWAGAAVLKLSVAPELLVETPAAAVDWLVTGAAELDPTAVPNEKPWAGATVEDDVPDAEADALVVGAAPPPPNENPVEACAADDAVVVCA